jgi:hypothetical protein
VVGYSQHSNESSGPIKVILGFYFIRLYITVISVWATFRFSRITLFCGKCALVVISVTTIASSWTVLSICGTRFISPSHKQSTVTCHAEYRNITSFFHTPYCEPSRVHPKILHLFQFRTDCTVQPLLLQRRCCFCMDFESIWVLLLP